MKMITNTMNEYIQEKIKIIEKEIDLLKCEVDSTTDDWSRIANVLEAVEIALQDTYNRGVEDSLSKVPTAYDSSVPFTDGIESRQEQLQRREGYNTCRQQTIDNINKLLTNK